MKSKSKLTIDQLVKLVRDLNPPKGKEFFVHDDGLSNFGIRVHPSGVATWQIRPFIRGRQRRVKIGDVLAVTRKEAIQKARRMIVKIEDENLDPQKAKRDAIASARKTFEVVVAEFIERKVEERLRSGTLTDYKRYLEKGYYFEPFHKRPFDEIGRDDFKKQIKSIERVSGNETAHKCHAAVKHLYDWAAGVDLFPENRPNPLSKVEAPVKNRSRDRVLTHDEIRIIWKACDDWEAQTLDFAARGIKREPGGFTLLTDYPRAVQLLFLTGMRAKEMGDLHWTEVRLPATSDKHGVGEIYLAPFRTKEKREKAIPLSGMAVDIFRKIERRPDDLCVFGRGDGRPIVLDGVPWKEGLYLGDTVPKIMKRLKRGNTSFWKHQVDPEQKKRIQYLLARGDISMTRIRIEEKIRFQTIQDIKAEMEAGPVLEKPPAPAMAPWRMHDIRRTFRTGLGEIGVHDSIGERLLGHLDPYSSKTQEAYARYAKWPEKIDAIGRWEARLKSILDGTAQEAPQSRLANEAANRAA